MIDPFYLNWWDYIAVFLIIFLGIPHGALDGAISFTFNNLQKNYYQFLFILGYILLALIVIILWIWLPIISLIFFLFFSLFHFGSGDLDWSKDKFNLLNSYFNGGVIIFGLTFLNQDKVSVLFKIISENDLNMVWNTLYFGIFFWLCSIVILLLYRTNLFFRKKKIMLLVFILTIIILFPPLPAFAIYFCFIHSFNHFKRVLPILKKNIKIRKVFFLMALFSIISWLVGALILFFILESNYISIPLIKITFIGLAALTVPHMILIDGFFRPKFKV